MEVKVCKVTNVTASKPRVGGAVFRAPLGAVLPTDAVADLDVAFKSLGYCSEDGLTNANSPSTTQVKAWGGDIVLTAQEERPDTFKFKLLEALNPEVLKVVYGDEKVSGDLTKGITVNATSEELQACAWVFNMLLRAGTRKRIVVPNGTVKEISEIVYKGTEPVGYEITIQASPDESGNNHYEYIKAKDAAVAAAAVEETGGNE